MILRATIFLPLLLLACTPPRAEPEPVPAPRFLRIGILSKYRPARLEIEGAGLRIFAGGRTIETHDTVTVELAGADAFTLRTSKESVRTAFAAFQCEAAVSLRTPGMSGTRRTSGRLEIEAVARVLNVVAELPFEDYVAATARAELGPAGTPDTPALIEAMRTAVRSYALAHRGRHAGESPAHDLCDLTHCMFFPGLTSIRTQLAEEARVLVHRNEPDRVLAAYFHSTCGGIPGGPEEYWPGHEASPHYRRVRKDTEAYCTASPHFRWRSRVVSQDELQNIVGHSAPPLRITGVRGYDAAGQPIVSERRALHLRIDRIDGRATAVPAHGFLSAAGRRLGWNAIKSNVFVVERHGEDFVFRGRGLGHGVGLCQWGARELARRGKTAREILEVYYPGALTAPVVYE